jgi:hypothetical protein
MNSNTVHVSIAGGFGNQLFQVSAALKLTSSSVIVHDFQNNARRSENGKLEIQGFNLPKRVEFAPDYQISRIGKKYMNLLYVYGTDSQKKTRSILSKIAVRLARLYFSRILGTKVEVMVASDLGDFTYRIPHAEILVIGYFQSWEWSHPLSEWAANRKFLPTRMDVDLPIQRLKEDNFVVCLHIRRGDYLVDSRIGTLNCNYFKRALDKLLLINPGAEIWLFSDDILDIKDWISQSYLSQVRVVPSGPTDLTFEAMRHANAYIISNSTFSWWAARTSYLDDALVIAPSPWFKELKSPKGIIPKFWQTLNSDFS